MFVLVPQIVFASWWNPFSWKVFSKKEVAPQTQIVNTEQVNKEEIEKLQKEINDLKSKQTESVSDKTTPVVKEIKKTTSVIDNSAKLKAEAEAKVKAELELKLKAEQEALLAKQKADEQAKIDAQNKVVNEYAQGLKAFENSINGYVEDYKNYYNQKKLLNRNDDKEVELSKSIYKNFTNDLDKIKIKWSKFRNSIMNEYQNDKTKMNDILAKYPQPSLEKYNKIPSLHNFIINKMPYYSLTKLGETQDYETFFKTYGNFGSDPIQSEELYYLKAGLANAITERYNSKLECSVIESYSTGCLIYFKALESEQKMEKFLSLLE